jgi:hypothetical protein
VGDVHTSGVNNQEREMKMIGYYAVRLTETRHLWYYLEATSGDTALDEATALHHEAMHHRGSSDGGADEIEGNTVEGEAYEMVEY